MILYVWPAAVFVWLFVLGSAVGSFLNVCIYRIPRGRSLMWPSSRCGSCLTPIPLYLNVPLVSWWWLRGRCRHCGARFSMRYFWVELLTGLVVAGLYYLEVGLNIHGLPVWRGGGIDYLLAGLWPPHSWSFLFFHTVLASLVIVATACLLERGELPRAVVVTGAVMGLAWAILYPWPLPLPVRPWSATIGYRQPGFMPCPVWAPLPDWLGPGSLALGVVTGVAGILGPAWLVRLAQRRLRSPEEGLLVMTGGFLGWQPLFVALALAGTVAIGLGLLGRTGRPSFALLLIAGLIAVWLGWAWIVPLVPPWIDSGLAPFASARYGARLAP
jgi:leader peptidase (prepilin peptidase)/N-methyltransferase